MADLAPSLEIMRPVTNLTVDDIVRFEDEVFELADDMGQGAALSGTEMQFRDRSDPQITLITAGEMFGFHREAGLPFERPDAGRLKNKLKRWAPESFNEAVSVPTFPASVYRIFRNTGHNVAFIALGAGERPLAERRIVQNLTHQFYEKPETNEAIARRWRQNEHLHRLTLAMVRGEERKVNAAVGIINLALSQTDIFPDVLECGPVKRERKSISQ